MSLEIERKFLVLKNWKILDILSENAPEVITQGYLFDTDDGVLRIRLSENWRSKKAYLTIKGRTKGITRPEFEYEIPYEEGEILINMCNLVMKKNRYLDYYMGKCFEIDVYEDFDFITAELELQDENQTYKLPSYILKDISDDPTYFNSNLIKRIKPSVYKP